MILQVDCEQETGGRWITEIAALPGVLVYGSSREDAFARVQAPALRVLADCLKQGGPHWRR